jgi:hypothetical protein
MRGRRPTTPQPRDVPGRPPQYSPAKCHLNPNPTSDAQRNNGMSTSIMSPHRPKFRDHPAIRGGMVPKFRPMGTPTAAGTPIRVACRRLETAATTFRRYNRPTIRRFQSPNNGPLSRGTGGVLGSPMEDPQIVRPRGNAASTRHRRPNHLLHATGGKSRIVAGVPAMPETDRPGQNTPRRPTLLECPGRSVSGMTAASMPPPPRFAIFPPLPQ